MNTIRLSALASLIALAVVLPVTALAQTENEAAATTYGSDTEQIEDFNTKIVVHSDASIAVTETIVYHFGPEQKHGIYRDIPIEYVGDLGKSVTLDLSNISVTDENGRTYPYVTSTQSNDNGGTDRRIKIGDPNMLIGGVHTYVISYTVPRAIGAYDGYDEIYWNATGTEWPVQIMHAEATVVLPNTQTIDESKLRIACYSGTYGSTDRCDGHTDGASTTSPTVVAFQQDNLRSYEGLTVAVGFPTGIVNIPPPPPPTWWELNAQYFYDFSVLLPILAFLIMFPLWKKYGKDPKGTGIITAQYEAPDGLSPMATKFVLDESFREAIASEIIYLASRGYLKISRTEDTILLFKTHDYELTKLKAADGALTGFQKILLDGLFGADISETITTTTKDGVTTTVTRTAQASATAQALGTTVRFSDLKDVFYVTARKVQEECMSELVSGGYFPAAHGITAGVMNGVVQTMFTKAASFLFAFMIIFFGLFIALFAAAFSESGVLGISVFVATVIIGVFVYLMPRRTAKGVTTRELIKGFKLYLSVAEKDRINFHDAPAKTPEVFQKFLPYAIALGVVDAWAKVFEGIDLKPPTWYNDPSMHGFNAGVFASSMGTFSSASTGMSAAPGSSGSSGSGGGGSSGGGGGGGGGGSW